jgi:hypothetical protein
VDAALNPTHAMSWWAGLIATSERFDAAYLVEELAGLLSPRIANRLVRREVDLAVATVNRHLLRPANEEFAEDAAAGRERLANTLSRLDVESTELADAAALSMAVSGDYPAAAAAAERLLGTSAVLDIVVPALRFEKFDAALAVRLLAAGRPPADAIRSGELIGRYQWWPAWLLDIATEQALAGRLAEDMVAALDACAYAPLTPAQTQVARRLLTGEPAALAAAATHLDRLGEHHAADQLRAGDLGAVALAAKLMSY